MHVAVNIRLREGSGFSSAGQRGAWEHASTLLTHSGGENPADALPAITHTHARDLACFIMHVLCLPFSSCRNVIKSVLNGEK